MAHQAETDQMVQNEEKRLYKERQKLYKGDLDRQYSEAMTRRLSKQEQKMPELNKIITGLDSERRDKEIKERKIAATIELAREMKEREMCMVDEKIRESSEKNDYRQFLNRLEENEQRIHSFQKERKLQLANALRQSYNQQELEKKQIAAIEKYNDARLLEQQERQWPVIDYEKRKLSEHIFKVEQNMAAKQDRFKSAVHDASIRKMQQQEEFLSKMKFEKEKKEAEIEKIQKERKWQVKY